MVNLVINWTKKKLFSKKSFPTLMFHLNSVFRIASLISRKGRLYVAREVAGDGYGDDEGGAYPEGAPEV